MADPNDPYAGLTPEEINAARGQDISSRQFWNWLRSTMDAPPVVRRPGYQALAGAAARGQDVNVARNQAAKQIYDEAQKRIEENRNRLNPSRTYAVDPGSADFAPFVAGVPKAAAPAPVVEAIPERRSPFDETNIAAPQFTPERRSPFDETNIGAPQFERQSVKPAAPARPSQTQQQTAPALSPETVTLRDLWAAANRPDASAADFFRADRAMQEAIKKGQDVGYYGQAEGKKAGGSVGEKPQKDAAIHKALEIIHHLLTRG